MFKRTTLFSSLCALGFIVSANDNLDELMSMSLDELSMLYVTMETASKFSQKLSDIPAAVYVLDGERIKRSGVRTIAEALALVPGINVTKFSDTEFFVSSRGFHDGLYNKMLVLMDGRSLFSPVYGGVYWTDIDYVLNDIERIEVLRGPGGTMWGGNAVNGVVNIITKSTDETIGTYTSGTLAKQGDYAIDVRHGFQVGDKANARFFAKLKENHSYPNDDLLVRRNSMLGVVVEGDTAQSHWTFRAGGEKSDFVQQQTKYGFYGPGNSYSGFTTSRNDVESHSFYLQSQLKTNHSESLKSVTNLVYQYDLDEALDAPGTYSTFQIDTSFLNQLTESHNLSYGAGYNFVAINFTKNTANTDTENINQYVRIGNTKSESDSIVNAFIQWEATWSDKVKTTLGVKGEYFEHSYAFEYSPQARIMYSLDEQHSFWAGIGRSVTSPSYMESSTNYYSVYYSDYYGDYFVGKYESNDDLDLESVVSKEVGYRYTGGRFDLDATLFSNKHYNARGSDYSHYEDQFDVYIQSDDYELDSQGAEVAIRLGLMPDWELYANYTYFTSEQSFVGNAVENPNYNDIYFDIEYQHLAVIQNLWQVTDSIQFDVVVKGQKLKYSDSYEKNLSSDLLPNYISLDARLAWKPSANSPELEFNVQNIGEKKGYYNDASQTFSSGFINEQLMYVRLSHEF